MVAKKPLVTITSGTSKERKLMDVANGKDKNAWVCQYTLPGEMDSNGQYSKKIC